VGERFVEATAVRRRAAAADVWDGEITPGWDIGGNANGGYLMTMAARAMAAAAGRPDPVTVTAHFLAPGTVGPIEAHAVVVRAGKRFSTVSARLMRDGQPIVALLGRFGELAGGDGPERVDGDPPDLPPVEECHRFDVDDPIAPGFRSRLDIRLHPDDAGFHRGQPSGRPLVRGWFRLLDDEPIDTMALLLAVDALPPTVFNAMLPIAWTPTVELTAHVRARPAPGWLRCSFANRFVTGGFLEEDGEVWDAAGRLVAQSRQLALVPRS
jgi:acyl-CoA thioesterase